jgi:hypothetical protein
VTKIFYMKTELKKDMSELKTELKQAMSDLKTELNTEFRL